MIDLTRGAKRAGVLVWAAICCLVWAAPGYAQGVTTGTLTGIVSDSQGGVLPGATVVAIHQPSGTEYTAVTQGDGRFVIPRCASAAPTRSTLRCQASAPRSRRGSRSRWGPQP